MNRNEALDFLYQQARGGVFSPEFRAAGLSQPHEELMRRAQEALMRSWWRPIETAPRDGMPFFCICAYDDGEKDAKVVRWDKEWGEWVTAGVRVHLYNTGDVGDDKYPLMWMPIAWPVTL